MKKKARGPSIFTQGQLQIGAYGPAGLARPMRPVPELPPAPPPPLRQAQGKPPERTTPPPKDSTE